MKTLVLCVDRDDDIGAKTGIQGPIVGRDANLAAAMRLGIADPEDSDVNALFSAISIYDGYRKENPDAEIATICGDVHVGTVSDIALTRQLDQILRDVRPERVFLVSDGAEDEAFSPIISSRIRVDHVRRVYDRPATEESEGAAEDRGPLGLRPAAVRGDLPRPAVRGLGLGADPRGPLSDPDLAALQQPP